MFEAQSRSQPKLVYAHASSTDMGRDQEGDMSSYVRNLVARIAKEEMNNQQPLTEIGIHANSLQSKQQGHETNPDVDKDKYLQREQLSQPKLTDVDHGAERKTPPERDISVKMVTRPFSVTHGINDVPRESNKRHLQPPTALNGKLRSQQMEMTQLRVGEGDTTKPTEKLAGGTKVDTVLSLSPGAVTERFISAGSQSTANRVQTVSLTSTASGKGKAAEPPSIAAFVEKGAPKTVLSATASVERVCSSSSPSSVINAERAVMILSHSKSAGNAIPSASITAAERTTSISPASTAAAAGQLEIASSLSKATVTAKATAVLTTSAAAAGGKLEAASPLPKTTIVDKLGQQSELSSFNVPNVSSIGIDPNQASNLNQFALTPKQIYSSSLMSTNNGNAQLKSSGPHSEETTVLQVEQQVIASESQQTKNAKLHATTIKINSYPQQRQQPSLIMSQSGNTDPSLISCSATPISNRLQSLAMPSSKRILESPSPVELDQDSEPILHSPNSCLAIHSSSLPKSILKSTTSFDKGDTLLITGNHNEESEDYCDFSSQKTSKNQHFSVKKQVQSLFKIKKITSPPPQLKRHVTGDVNMTISELRKDGKVPKKSVSFNSEVRLHLENDESTVETLPMDE